MFGVVKNMINRARALNQDEILEEVVSNEGVKQQIVDWNKDQLYEKGIDAAGQPTGQYSAATIHGTKDYPGKIQKGQRYDHITLKDTGEFYDSMKVEVDEGGFKVTGDMQKPGTDLSKQWPEALGLTDDSIGEVLPMVTELMQQQLRTRLMI